MTNSNPAPVVSCIMATGRRKHFLRQAIKYFGRQTFEARELIIVDDDEEPAEALIPENSRIQYYRVPRMSLGRKLNLAVEKSKGFYIQKLDDDDWYHPDFLSSMVAGMTKLNWPYKIGSAACFLVLLLETGELKHSGYGWFVGGSLCFTKSMWEKKPFEDRNAGEDDAFITAHRTARPVSLTNPELYIVIRGAHQHLWTHLDRGTVDDWFKTKCKPYTKPLEALMPAEDVEFYKGLMAQRKTVGS